jgi:hypothetical protein
MVNDDFLVTVSLDNPVDNDHIYYLESVHPSLIAHFISESYADLKNFHPWYHFDSVPIDPNDLPIFSSRKGDCHHVDTNLFFYTTAMPEIFDDYYSRPYNVQHTLQSSYREIVIFLRKISQCNQNRYM